MASRFQRNGNNDSATVQTKVTRTVTKRTIIRNPDGTETVKEETYVENEGEFDPGLRPPLPAQREKSPSRFKSLFGGGDKSASSTPSAAPMSSAKKMSDKEFQEDSLKWHNHYRAKHGIPPLTISKELCKFAQEWADTLAKRDAFEHRPNNKHGENIYMKWSSDPNFQITGKEAVESWYSEIKDHTFGVEPRTLASGHFTQVIWKTSKELGVAQAKSKSGKILVVANYSPAGNLVGTFAENVPAPKK